MHRSVFVLCFVFLSSFTVTSATTFPQLALGGGYECVVVISNKSAEQWKGAVESYRGNHEQWNIDWFAAGQSFSKVPALNVTLGPFTTMKITLNGDSQVRAGYFEIDSASGFSDLDLAVSFFYNFYQDGVLKDSTGIPKASWDKGFMLPVEKTKTVNTGLAWAPLFARDPFDIKFTLYDNQGTLVNSATVTYEGHDAKFFTELFASNIPNGFVGLLHIEFDQSMYLTALRLETVPGGFQLTGVPPDSMVP